MRDRQHPFESMEQFFDQMRREMFAGTGTPALAGHESDDSRRETPAIDSRGAWDAGISMEETDDGLVVLADLPGFDREELSVRLHGDRLYLDGEHEVGEGAGYRSRRVSERITLPVTPDPAHVHATYHNGVLELRFVVESDDEGTGVDIHIE
jgi:HSP20 family protein